MGVCANRYGLTRTVSSLICAFPEENGLPNGRKHGAAKADYSVVLAKMQGLVNKPFRPQSLRIMHGSAAEPRPSKVRPFLPTATPPSSSSPLTGGSMIRAGRDALPSISLVNLLCKVPSLPDGGALGSALRHGESVACSWPRDAGLWLGMMPGKCYLPRY
jgi:hypothetical protein